MLLMDIISEIHQFNEDKNVAKLRSLYESNSFLNSLSVSLRVPLKQWLQTML